jgi:hypothetical protein
MEDSNFLHMHIDLVSLLLFSFVVLIRLEGILLGKIDY